MKHRANVTALICLALSGCQPGDEPPEVSCGAARLGGWIGQSVTLLDEQYLPQTVRQIRPGDTVTQDHQPGRLNVMLHASDHVIGFRCG